MNTIKDEFPKKLQELYGVSPEEASDQQVYRALSSVIVNLSPLSVQKCLIALQSRANHGVHTAFFHRQINRVFTI